MNFKYRLTKKSHVYIVIFILTNALTLMGTRYMMLNDPFSDRTEMKKSYPYSGNIVIKGGKLDKACGGYAKYQWSKTNDTLKKRKCLFCIYWYEYTECVKQYEKRLKMLENKLKEGDKLDPLVG